jgi:hypothetical protein
MSRTVHIELGVNGAFITRRWEKPENFMRLTAETGFKVHEFCADVLDPFFMGPMEFLLEQAAEVKKWAEHYGVTICDIYTGMCTHRFHSFAASRPEPGERMKQWLLDCWDLCLAMGTKCWGGHVDAVPVEVIEDEAAYEACVARLEQTWRDMAVLAAEKGMEYIAVEQMYIPSEVPWTLKQQQEFLIATNKDRKGVPVYTTVDVGHAASMHYGKDVPDTDYREWLRRFAPWSPTIHLQQTNAEGSHHWPFTRDYNEVGHINMDEVMATITAAHREAEDSPIIEFVPPVDKQYLILELIPGSTKTEAKLLDEMKASARYLRRYVPEAGLDISA